MQFSFNFNISGICKTLRHTLIWLALLPFCCICMISCHQLQQKAAIADNENFTDTSHYLSADDYQKFLDLLQAAEDSVDYNKPLAYQFLQQARLMVQDSPSTYEYARLLNTEAIYYYYVADYPKATQSLRQSVGIFKKAGRIPEAANTLSKLGLTYLYEGAFKPALNALFEGLQLVNNGKDSSNLLIYSRLLGNTSLVYEQIGDFDNALKYQTKYLSINRQRKDTSAMARALNNMGNTFFDQNKLDSAMYYFKASADLAAAIGQDYGKMQTLGNIGNVFYELHQPDSALKYFDSVLAYYDQVGEVYGRCLILAGLAATWLDLKDYEKAASYLKACENCHEVVSETSYWAELYRIGGKLYWQTGDYPKAVKSYEKSHDLRDSMVKQSKNLDLIKFAVSYDFKQKAEADSLKMKLRIETSEQKSLRASNRLLIAALLLVLTGVLAILWFFRSRMLAKRSIISEQKRLLSQKLQQEMEQKLLRSQMNPHFIFNCLNTIDSFVLQNKKTEASRLIQRFSKLSRQVLEFTAQTDIAVKEEMDLIRVYLQIEQTRYSGHFDFTVQVDQSIRACRMPPMLIQPFAENAVVHGIKNRVGGGGLIEITAVAVDNQIKFTVSDNGIGRKMAQLIKNEQQKTHNSRAMKITASRLADLNGGKITDQYLRYTDLEGEQSGTIVEIWIPKILPH